MTDEPKKPAGRHYLLWVVVAVTFLYVCGNLLVISTITLIHESKVTFIVVDSKTGKPLSDMQIWRGMAPPSTSTTPLSGQGQAPLRGRRAPLGSMLVVDRPDACTTDLGKGQVAAHVQDQGAWAWPRLGVRANFSGERFWFRKAHYGTTEIVLPRYQGQSKSFTVQIDPER